jgi:hypothetical protein
LDRVPLSPAESSHVLSLPLSRKRVSTACRAAWPVHDHQPGRPDPDRLPCPAGPVLPTQPRGPDRRTEGPAAPAQRGRGVRHPGRVMQDWPAQSTPAVLVAEWWKLRAQDSSWAAAASSTSGSPPLSPGSRKVLLGERRRPDRHEVGLPMPQNGDLRRISNDRTTSTSQNFLPAQD